MARAIALALAVLVAGALPAQATADGGNPDYRSEVTQIVPGVSGISAEVLNYDADMQLTNRSGEDVVVLGYDGEPYLRFAADGKVEVNTNSEAYYLNEDRYAEVDIPDDLNPKAPPEWKEVAKDNTFAWHDHRSHFMSKGTPQQVTDKSKKTKVFDYSIPLEVGGKQGAIDGTLFWVGQDSGFPIAPFIGLGVVVLVLGGLVIARRRQGGSSKEAW